MSSEEYYKSLYGENPADYNGKNPSCKLCDKEAENLDEYCEEHQRCYYCGERETCEEEGTNCKGKAENLKEQANI